MPHLRKGAMKDWVDLLTASGIYDERMHDKTNSLFFLGGSIVEFFALDMPGKARGPRRDILFFNEVNLCSYDMWQQLLMRTRETVYCDFNPVDEFHWLYDKVLTKPDTELIVSTYKDNPFLSRGERQEIEGLQDTDENLWRVFGLGQRGQSRGRVYNNWNEVNLSDDTRKGEVVYGIDFGYNVPTAVVKLYMEPDGRVYVEELIYETNLTNGDLIERLKAIVEPKRAPIYADSAEPDRIEEIYRAGFNIHPADKSVEDGILSVKQKKLFVTNTSINIWKEYRSYSYQKDKNDHIIDAPVKYQDHAMDAIRYPIHTHKKKTSRIVMTNR